MDKKPQGNQISSYKEFTMSAIANFKQRQLKKQAENNQNKESRLAFNVNEWLKSVQTAIVKAPLLATTA